MGADAELACLPSDEDVGRISQTCEPSDPPPAPPQRVRAAVFFDGTGNNRTNSGAEPPLSARLPLGSESYGNAPSNVAKGEASMSRYPEVDNIGQSYYIEGVGTQTGGRDVPQGMIEGRGGTGVPAKMLKGLRQLVADAASLDRSRPIEYVHIDTFGFSRGAAAARHFVHVALHHPELNVMKQLTDRGFAVGVVRVTFVGLYDTVASYGFRHSNDTADLQLDAIRHAEYVFQLAAGEEHRKNFRLTDIQSAAAGRQVFLPGVHSDIGGGYVDNADEVDLQVVDLDWRGILRRREDLATLERERQWLLAREWYHERELSEPNFSWEIIANRKGIRSTYSHLPLNMMADEARPRGVPFSDTLGVRHPVPSDPIVQRVRALIDETIALGNERKDRSWQDYWLRLIDRNLGALRHKYLHMSSAHSLANSPHYTGHPSKGGVRRRVVQRG